MNDYTPGYILDKYNEKINSVGYKLKQAIGHPIEQTRLVMQLKVYINSMINDLSHMDDTLFDSSTRAFADISELYNISYGILTSITSLISGSTIDVTGSDTDAVMTKDSNKEATIQKFRMILAGIDKVIRYLNTLSKPAEESTFFDEIGIAEESSAFYKMMRLSQTSRPGLHASHLTQKKECEKRYKDSRGDMEKEKAFAEWLNKSIQMTQRKINGKEIKHKDLLQKDIDLYKSYLNKIGHKATESSIYSDLLANDTTIYEDLL